jgi:hypothetical protein
LRETTPAVIRGYLITILAGFALCVPALILAWCARFLLRLVM